MEIPKYNIWRKWPPGHSLETDPLCLGVQGKSSPFGAPDISFRVMKESSVCLTLLEPKFGQILLLPPSFVECGGFKNGDQTLPSLTVVSV